MVQKRTGGFGKKLISEIRVGWNSELGIISASDEWWKKKTQFSYWYLFCLDLSLSCPIS